MMVRLLSQAKYVGTVSRNSGYDEAVMCVLRSKLGTPPALLLW